MKQADIECFARDRDPERLFLVRTAAVDNLLSEALLRELREPGLPPVAICAVGGYGRRELFPYSDVDLLVVVPGEPDLVILQPYLANLLRHLWDTGLRISHSVHTIAECTRLQPDNAELHVSLLDLRPVAGDSAVFSTLVEKLAAAEERWRLPLIPRLKELCLARHLKFNQTVYHLEPNVKETCGGLRDWHTLRWLGQLLPNLEPVREAIEHLDDSRHFLFLQRAFLHLQARRDANLLSFDLQDQSARALPIEAMPPEAWMRLYFGHARRIFQATQMALDSLEGTGLLRQKQWRKWRGDRGRDKLSTSEFTVVRDQVSLATPEQFLASPAELLRLFIFCGRYGLTLAWETQRQIRPQLSQLAEQFASEGKLWPLWRELFGQPKTSIALEEMVKTGVLMAALPEWSSIDSLVVRDFYHRYTVDEHTLVTLQAIDQLIETKKRPGATSAADRMVHLASEEGDLPALRLALLLHDLGKGTLPGDHVRGSVETAPVILGRLGVPAATRAAVLFLIENHLHLSFLMNARDLEDPATARFLTSHVSTQEDLRRLTLLTYADISAVNPTAMTPWRLEQLWRVYLLGTEQLTRELSSDRIHLMAADAKPGLQQFLEGLPRRYLRTHTGEEIAHHQAMAEASRRRGVAVEVQPDGTAAGVWQLTVLAHDQPGLLASLCGVLASFGMNIVKGEACSNAAGFVVDILRFDDPHRTLELNPEERERLSQTVENVVRGEVAVTELLKRRRALQRQAAEATTATTVRCNNDASDTATLIDFSGEDRPGLLYDLTSAIHNNGCNIEVLMIDTEAHRASDVFYVTCDGRKLDSERMERIQTDLLRAAEA